MTTISIPLTQDKVALIDAEDYSLVSNHNWHALHISHARTWYAFTKVKRADGVYTQIGMHCFIMGSVDDMHIDHISRDGLDNRRSNLRYATRTQNKANSEKYRTNTSGYKGVYWWARGHQWRAQVRCRGVRYHLGQFATAEEAAHAYDANARRLFGPFALCNFPDDCLATP